jgi:hypothetical protein
VLAERADASSAKILTHTVAVGLDITAGGKSLRSSANLAA